MVKIYALGSNGCGQLGIGHLDDVSTAQLVRTTAADQLKDSQVKRIVAGGNHTLLHLHDSGILWTGSNEDDRCGGTGDLQHTFIPLTLTIADSKHTHFFDVAATWSASFFVLQDRCTVLVRGRGEHGELGLGEDVTATTDTSFLHLPDKIVSIESCLSHVVVVLANGQVWGWGKGRKGQLGSPNIDCWSPRRIDIVVDAVKAVCGADFTCVVDKTDCISVLGADGRDRFKIRSNAPQAIPGWYDIAASWGSIVARTAYSLQAWGRNDRGQLPPSDLPKVSRLAMGSEHWLVLTESGEVLSGGWGEHGNCGIPRDEFGVVKGRYNVLEGIEHAMQVFAGCATSFVVVNDGDQSNIPCN